MLLKPVPYAEPDTLVQLTNANNGALTGPAAFYPATLLALVLYE